MERIVHLFTFPKRQIGVVETIFNLDSGSGSIIDYLNSLWENPILFERKVILLKNCAIYSSL